MIEIQSNPSIKDFKEEYAFTLGLRDLVIGGMVSVCGISIYMKCEWLPDMIRGDLCMFIVLAGMFLFHFRINNLLLFSFIPKILGNLLYFNKPILHQNKIIREGVYGRKNI